MSRYGKSTQNAIAAMSHLAEVYPRGERLSSGDIAQVRGLPQTLTAKLLTQLSQAGLVSGSPGPGGGYALAKPPIQITLLDISQVFERMQDPMICPFGPQWCGQGEPCPLHAHLQQLNEQFDEFLKQTTLQVFVGKAPQRKRARQASSRRPSRIKEGV
ncbi:MAG: HTH-type transcriptional regulator IscR [Phycisphaerae bacterium]|nr:HTH-type transcriptional regulator IscR [Phycisphaerae bacterium]